MIYAVIILSLFVIVLLASAVHQHKQHKKLSALLDEAIDTDQAAKAKSLLLLQQSGDISALRAGHIVVTNKLMDIANEIGNLYGWIEVLKDQIGGSHNYE